MLSSIYRLENSYPYHCFAMYIAFIGTYVAAALSNNEKGLDDPERLFPVLVGIGGSLSQAYHLHQITSGVKPSDGALVAHSLFLGNFWTWFAALGPYNVLSVSTMGVYNWLCSSTAFAFTPVTLARGWEYFSRRDNLVEDTL